MPRIARVNGFSRVRKGLGKFGLATALLLAPVGTSVALANDVVVFAAASLKNALDDDRRSVENGDREDHSNHLRREFRPRQADRTRVVLPISSFPPTSMDGLSHQQEPHPHRHPFKPAGQSHCAGGADRQRCKLDRAGHGPRRASRSDGKLAMADVDAVPAGKYGKAALETLGVWASVAGSVAQADNVRAALAFVSRGEAPLGIVYQTDANAEPAVKIVGVFPEDSHPPIIYPVAMTAASENPKRRGIPGITCIRRRRRAFEKQGFTVCNAGCLILRRKNGPRFGLASRSPSGRSPEPADRHSGRLLLARGRFPGQSFSTASSICPWSFRRS